MKKAHLKISISGGCSAGKTEIAQKIYDMLKQEGFGEVRFKNECGEDHPFDGFIAEEIAEVKMK